MHDLRCFHTSASGLTSFTKDLRIKWIRSEEAREHRGDVILQTVIKSEGMCMRALIMLGHICADGTGYTDKLEIAEDLVVRSRVPMLRVTESCVVHVPTQWLV